MDYRCCIAAAAVQWEIVQSAPRALCDHDFHAMEAWSFFARTGLGPVVRLQRGSAVRCRRKSNTICRGLADPKTKGEAV
jgi:hypothetical protein